MRICSIGARGIALLLLAGLSVLAQDHPPEEEKPAKISGIATNSLSGEPLPRVEVWLLRKISGRFSSYTHTVTGGDGRFSLTGIEAGAYFITAERNGYSRVDVPFSTHPPTLALKAGEEIKDVVLKMIPNAVIGGRVLDAEGTPMEHVQVKAVGRAFTRDGETDDRGEFAIGGVLPGRYLLRAYPEHAPAPEIRKDGSVAINYGVTYFPSSLTLHGAVPVIVRAGQESRAEIKMRVVPALHIRGNVRGQINGGTTDVLLWDEWGGLPVRYAVIDEKGAFTFSPLRAGRYRLYAESWNGPQHMQSAPVLVELANASMEGIHLALFPWVEVAGHIKAEDWERIAGESKRSRDTDFAEIWLFPAGFFVEDTYSSKLSNDGSFHFGSIAPGRYFAILKNAGANFYLKSLQMGEREFHNGTLEVGGGPEQQEMLIELGADGAEISGTVRDAKGGVGQALVFLIAEAGTFSAYAGETRSAEDGSYVIRGVTPGKYKIFAFGKNDGLPYLGGELFELDRDFIQEIEVAAGDKFTQDLKIPME